ncbi:MAG: T9SS type A sorting domain-containing protein [Opitutaceae bacterium]|nr:T9SS type A sorting domain-containing protein [Cytophagales bacterium]
MKTSILISFATLVGLSAFAQTSPDKIADNTVIIIVNNDNDKAEKEKEEKDKKDKKDKDDKNGNGNNGNGNNGTSNNGNGPLGLEDANSYTSISTYPNPAVEQLYISNIPANANSYTLTNMEGGETITGRVTASELSMNVKNYPKGIYTVQLLDNNQAVLYKNRIVISN